jgi:hypothetical protein
MVERLNMGKRDKIHMAVVIGVGLTLVGLIIYVLVHFTIKFW